MTIKLNLEWLKAHITFPYSIFSLDCNYRDGDWQDISTKTFNDIAEFALASNQPELAERVLEIIQADGYQPNGKTYALQLAQGIDNKQISSGNPHLFDRMLNEERRGEGEVQPEAADTRCICQRWMRCCWYSADARRRVQLPRLHLNLISASPGPHPPAFRSRDFAHSFQQNIVPIAGI